MIALGAPPALVMRTAISADKLVMSSPWQVRERASWEDGVAGSPSTLILSSLTVSLGAAVAETLPVGDKAEAVLCGESASSGTGPLGESVEMEEAPPGDMAAMADKGDNGAEDGVIERCCAYLLGNWCGG